MPDIPPTEDGHAPDVDNADAENHERVVITDKEAERYLYLLITLTTNNIRQRANAVIPPEAFDFIGPQRAAINEKMKAVLDLGLKIQNARHETTYHEALNQVIKDLVTFSSRPVVSMTVISRLWKYLDDNSKIPLKKNDTSLYPTNFSFRLNSFALKKGYQPLTWDEEKALCDQIKDWKDKKKTPEDIIKRLDSMLESARSSASFPTRRSREYAKNALINRKALDARVQHLLAIKKYLEDLFAKKAAEEKADAESSDKKV